MLYHHVKDFVQIFTNIFQLVGKVGSGIYAGSIYIDESKRELDYFSVSRRKGCQSMLRLRIICDTNDIHTRTPIKSSLMEPSWEELLGAEFIPSQSV